MHMRNFEDSAQAESEFLETGSSHTLLGNSDRSGSVIQLHKVDSPESDGTHSRANSRNINKKSRSVKQNGDFLLDGDKLKQFNQRLLDD